MPIMPNRSRIDTYWVEMTMFLEANYSFLSDYKNTPQIVSEDLCRCLPARFDGKNDALLEAEAAIDPVVNNASVSKGDMILD